MSSDSNATITYTSMSSYEVTVNGYFGMSMDPYAQLVIKATPSPDYIPGPGAPSSPEYIPGLEYPEYLSPADDVFPVEEQPLPAVVSPTAEGDDDANDDGDDLSEDDVDEEDEEESSDSEEEEEEHLALVVPAPTLHSSISASEDSDQTEPFEEGETTAIPPPSAYQGIPEADMPLWKKACFTTPIGGYEVGESSVAAAARQIRPALTIDDNRRAKDRLIGRLRRESISNCTAENQVKFASCTLIGSALTWWNSHMREISQKVAYAVPWKTLRQMMTAKRRFSEESDEIERYVGGLPKMIRGNVMSYEPKLMQKAIEFANDQIDQKLLGIADRQADNKRKFNNTSRNQQNQQPFKRNNNAGNGNVVARAYAVGTTGGNPDANVVT
nr:hypothetical protein [Tanacetum cinerariifolium]